MAVPQLAGSMTVFWNAAWSAAEIGSTRVVLAVRAGVGVSQGIVSRMAPAGMVARMGRWSMFGGIGNTSSLVEGDAVPARRLPRYMSSILLLDPSAGFVGFANQVCSLALVVGCSRGARSFVVRKFLWSLSRWYDFPEVLSLVCIVAFQSPSTMCVSSSIVARTVCIVSYS